MGFPTSHQPRLCITPNIPKMGFRYPKMAVFREISTKKTLKVRYRVSLCKNFQWQSYNVIDYLSNTINIVAGDDPVPVKFGPKGTDFL